MRRLLKWIGIALAGLVGILMLAVVVLSFMGGQRIDKQYDVQPEPVAVSDEAAAIERGRYIVSVSCAGCHGEDLGGKILLDDPAMGVIPAPNLTAGQGGAGASFNDTDFVRAIRHGVGSDGRPLAVMPSRAYWHFSDEDLGAIIAYLNSVPPVDNDMGEREIKAVGRILIAAGMMDVLAAESIDHTGPRPAGQEQQVNAAYGEYLANTGDYHQCHGPTLTGAQSSEPGAPPGPDLTAAGSLANWTAADFIEAMRTGVTPDGRQLDGNFMPWKEYARLSDDDLTALYLYLQTLDTAVTSAE